MTFVYPYPVSFLTDILPISAITWDIKRNDKISGQGTGRVWPAELAPPLWKARVELDEAVYIRDAERYAARIRKLHGAQEAFFLYNPAVLYPYTDRDGSKLGTAGVTIATIGDDRASISLAGLPGGYKLTDGDKFSFTYGSSPIRYAFHEVSEPVTASSSGVTREFGVFPHLPYGLEEGTAVNFARAACLMFIMPNTHNPGRANRGLQSGAVFEAMQRRRP